MVASAVHIFAQMIDLSRLVVLYQVIPLGSLLLRLLQRQNLIGHASPNGRRIDQLLSLMVLELQLMQSLLLGVVRGSMARVVGFAATRSGAALRRGFLAQVLASVKESTLQLLLLSVKVD